MSANTLLHLSPQPLYAQIKDALHERILDGTCVPHSQMPSEHEPCAVFGVSRIMVRQALGDLQKEGLIFRLHSKGAFVSKPRAFQNVTSLQGFAEAMSSVGYEIVNQLRRFRVVKADRRQASRLQLQEGTPWSKFIACDCSIESPSRSSARGYLNRSESDWRTQTLPRTTFF